MIITIDNTNCNFIITTFEGKMTYRIVGILENKTYNSYEEVYTQLCNQVTNRKSVEFMQNGAPVPKSNVKMWFKKDSTNVWSFNSNVWFAFTSCYNSISNCDAFASLIFTPYINNSCYKQNKINFCNPDVPYYIAWRYSSIHVKHDNGKLINLKITPGSYDIYSLVNTINKQMGVECAFWYGYILQFQQIKFVVTSGDLAYFFRTFLTSVISKNDAIALGIPSKQILGDHQTIVRPDYESNALVTFRFNKCPHIKDAVVCNWNVGITLRIAQMYVSDATYKGVIQHQYKQLHFDIPSIYTCGITPSFGIFMRYNWNCKTNDPDSFITINEDIYSYDAKIYIKNIDNGVNLISQDNIKKFGNLDDTSNLSLFFMNHSFNQTENRYVIDYIISYYSGRYTCDIANSNVGFYSVDKQIGCSCMSTVPNICNCANKTCTTKNTENFSILPENNSNDKFDTILVLSGITIGMLLLVYSLK